MMATPPYSFFFLIFLFIGQRGTNSHSSNCDSTTCENHRIPLPFPFWLNKSNQSNYRCGYPGFELKCSNKDQTLLNLPESGDFIVKEILNQDREIWVNVDQDDGCLPRRIMLNGGLSLAGSPFQLGSYFTLANYSFFSCPNEPTLPYSDIAQYSIGCLRPDRNINNFVLATLSDHVYLPSMKSCHLISSAMVPIQFFRARDVYWTSYLEDIQLQWDNLPDQSKGHSKKTVYGLAIGLGIPGFIGMFGLACLFNRWRRTHNEERHQHSREFSTTMGNNNNNIHLPVVIVGLDKESIERYPKSKIGDSGRLPKPNDTTCSICLCEYQPKEVLRTIPDCNHYFHVDCIDGWLRMNATCPLCRNLPLRSSSTSSSLPFSPTSSQ